MRPFCDSSIDLNQIYTVAMDTLIKTLMPWGPVFFGVFIFGPMWSAALGLNLPLVMVIGGVWGYVAKVRGTWF